MATSNIVSMLLESGGTIGNLAVNMPQYTLECGAALIARESSNELHEIFELAIVETNEAALGAYLEGSKDVMESATYGPVFEEAEKKVGTRIIDFLKNLKNKVFAFFRNIIDRITLAVNNYEKFYESKKDAMKDKTLTDCPCVDWNDKNIDMVSSNINKAATSIGSFLSDISGAIKNIAANGSDDNDLEKIKSASTGFTSGILSSIGVGAPPAGKTYDSTELHTKIVGTLRGKDQVKKTIDAAYIKKNLEGTKKAAKDVRAAQKIFNAQYDAAIKNIKTLVSLIEKSEKKGVSQHLNSAVSMLSKGQNIINTYASAGFSAIVARATESKKLASALISGKKPNEKKSKGDKNDNGGDNK